MKKILRMALCVTAVSVLLGGCFATTANVNNGVKATDSLDGREVLVGNIPIKFPLASPPATLNIMATGFENLDHADVYVWKKYAQMSGVDVNWATIKKDKRAEAVHNALTNHQNLDLILRCKISTNRLTQYGKSGLILDLAKDGLLEKYAPNCWAYLKAHPDTLASIMNPDGTVYALPQVNSGAELRVARKIFINKKWLKNVNMDVPKTTEEFYRLLLAFKEQDANGNGNPDDEIPFSSMDWLSVQEAFYGSFGLANRGLHNFDVDFDSAANDVRLIAASEGYRSYLGYFNRLFKEGLLDNYIFTVTQKGQMGTYIFRRILQNNHVFPLRFMIS